MITKNFFIRLSMAFVLAITITSLFSSCQFIKEIFGGGPEDVLPTKDQVWNYYSSKLDSVPSFESGFAAYFDFSDGMSYAYKDEATRDNLKGITQKVTGSDWIVYGMASNRLDTLKLSQTELYNRITQPRYTEIMAPIEQALISITNNRKRALLVTDFEEYTSNRRIQYQNYAKKYFIKWLKEGGCINFYVTDYRELNQNKHLYFAVFDDNEGSLTKVIDAALEGRSKNYKRFSLNNDPVSAENTYTMANRGGNYHDSQGNDNVTNVNENDPEYDMYARFDNVEFYPCGDSWANIKKNAVAISEMPGPDKYYALLRGVILNAGNKDSYIVDGYALKVTNVQKDFQLYTDYQSALRNPADITVNADGTKTVDFITHHDSKYYYDPVSGEIFPEYVYTPQDCPNVPDMFVLRSDVMEQSRKENPSKTEVAIDFSPNFTGVSNLVNPEDLLRLDVVIDKVSIDYSRLGELFQWGPDKNREMNNNLLEAVRNTLQEPELSPEGKIVYTYFIKAY